MQIPVPLPPNLPGFDVTVTQVKSLRPDMKVGLRNGGSFQHYCKHLTGTANITERTKEGKPAIMRRANIQYRAGCPDPQAFQRILAAACTEVAIATYALPKGLRLCDTAAERFWFNYSAETQTFEGKTFAPTSVLRTPLPGAPSP
jgi:beta-galactosidase